MHIKVMKATEAQTYFNESSFVGFWFSVFDKRLNKKLDATIHLKFNIMFEHFLEFHC